MEENYINLLIILNIFSYLTVQAMEMDIPEREVKAKIEESNIQGQYGQVKSLENMAFDSLVNTLIDNPSEENIQRAEQLPPHLLNQAKQNIISRIRVPENINRIDTRNLAYISGARDKISSIELVNKDDKRYAEIGIDDKIAYYGLNGMEASLEGEDSLIDIVNTMIRNDPKLAYIGLTNNKNILKISPNGRYILAAVDISPQTMIIILDILDKKLISTFVLNANYQNINKSEVCFDYDSKYAFSTFGRNMIIMVNISTGKASL